MMTISLSFPLILASASPRRKELLRSIGLKFKIIASDIDESYITGESPENHVRRLSRAKAAAVANQHQKTLVLGADTIVVIDDLILGKPKNKKQAREMMQRLSDRRHTVFTGFTITRVFSGLSKTRVVRSDVRFKKITPEEMNWYANCSEPYDKAGGYAVQGLGAYFIKAIHGSYTNVIGLPLCETMEELQKIRTVQFR